jgi:serine/threonine-protein kinase PknK
MYRLVSGCIIAESFPAMVRSGDRLADRYRLLEVAGGGGSATTWLAHDELFGSRVALKLLRADTPELEPVLRDEFARLARLAHPRLCRVHDWGTDSRDGARLCFYTAAYVDGLPLTEFSRGRAWPELVPAIVDAVDALGFLHRAGITHGDFKPENVLVDREARGVLIDLGCAGSLTGSGARPHMLSGTLEFIAPELVAGGAPDVRSDLFALGVSLRVVCERARGVPAGIRELLARLCANDRYQRPADAGEVLDVLGAPERAHWLAASAPSKLIGRDDALAPFEQAFDDLLAGRPGVRALIAHGADGIGKTRLLSELKWEAQLRARVVEGHVEGGGASGLFARAAELERAGGSADPLSVVERTRAALAALDRPSVLVLDDVDRLPSAESALFWSFVRLLDPGDRWIVCCTCSAPPALPAETVAVIELRPFGVEQVRAWAGGLVSERGIVQLLRASEGRPAELERLIAELAAGRVGEGELERAAGAGSLPARRAREIVALPDDQRRALAACIATGGKLGEAERVTLGVRAEALATLAAAGHLRLDRDGFKLTRPSELAAIRELLPRALGSELHQALAAELAPRCAEQPAFRAPLAMHLCAGGDVRSACRLARAELARGGPLEPRAWAGAADELVASGDLEALICAADLYDLAGRSSQAADLLEPLCQHAARPDLARRLAACRLHQGDAEAALEVIERALPGAAEERARLLELASRALVKRGEHEQALARAEQALAADPDPVTRAALHEDIGVAESYLGRHDRARSELERAAELGAAGEPRTQLRIQSYLAINDFRAGRTASALAGYGKALALAERHGLSDQMAVTLLNLGTAHHQLGEWGPALEAYQRGHRAAHALGQSSTLVRLAFDLGKLHSDIGAFERAASWAERAERASTALSLEFFAAAALSLRGEIALHRRELVSAASWLTEAAERFRAQGALREWAEVELDRAELELQQDDRKAASERAAALAPLLSEHAIDDLSARRDLLLARLALSAGEPDRAQRLLDGARARSEGQVELLAQIELACADGWRARGADELAAQHRRRARELWERAAATLPEPLRAAFWQHPRRVSVRIVSTPLGGESDRERKLLRLLDVNRRLASSLEMDRVLALAIDSAIELTGAERGFLILAQAQRLEVAIAKNFDRERIGKRHVKFSHGIARRVIRSAEPLLTIDASADARLRDAASVHAMKLRSVLCVPVRSSEQVLGAIYLDNRFAQARFGPEDVDLLLAFADQVAIALTNARLHAELLARSEQLDVERRRVEELARGQSDQLELLRAEVRARRDVIELRHDYGRIVGRSAAMRRLLETLDRVIDSEISVLISGESGTGKELVARAIHFNGRTRTAPFVAVNCAALPDTLLESELFGHVRGAFTGADRDRDGLMVAARGGTLFLDELGETSAGMQVKLLRALQEREVRPLGGARALPVEFRLVCATNRELAKEVRAGRFREDLYYRIGVVELRLPPLRERREDLPELARQLLERAAAQVGRPGLALQRAALKKLLGHDWPGNVRELENVLTKAVVLCEREVIGPEEIDLAHGAPRPARGASSRAEFRAAELASVDEALRRARWNVSEAARQLGVSRATLYRRLRQLERAKPAS